MIAAVDLKKYFGAVAAVDGVSFTARDGHVTGLLGPNGAGKTTTLRMLYARDAPRRRHDRGRSHRRQDSTRATRRRASASCPTSPGSTRASPRASRCEYFGELHGLEGGVLERADAPSCCAASI